MGKFISYRIYWWFQNYLKSILLLRDQTRAFTLFLDIMVHINLEVSEVQSIVVQIFKFEQVLYVKRIITRQDLCGTYK